jgi:hypothetical protein
MDDGKCRAGRNIQNDRGAACSVAFCSEFSSGCVRLALLHMLLPVRTTQNKKLMPQIIPLRTHSTQPQPCANFSGNRTSRPNREMAMPLCSTVGACKITDTYRGLQIIMTGLPVALVSPPAYFAAEDSRATESSVIMICKAL